MREETEEHGNDTVTEVELNEIEFIVRKWKFVAHMVITRYIT